VTEEAAEAEQAQMEECHGPLWVDDARELHERRDHDDDREHPGEALDRDDLPAREGRDERGEVDAERQHPEERRRRDLAREVLRDAEEER
jgi:hypothetical protein